MKTFFATPAVQAALLIAAAWAMLYLHAFENFIPHDAGLLGQMADRLLHGQTAHIDFEDTYTGGLNYLHAGFFLLLGERLTSLRWCLLLAALPWLVTLHWMARRVLPPVEAALFFLAAVAWSLPVYMESMPSWHVLFLATWGCAALWKHSETGHWKWLLLAGTCGALSGLVKITGILFLPAAAMYVFGRLALGIGEKPDTPPGSAPAAWGMRILLTAALVGVALIPAWITRPSLSAATFVHFALPLAAWSAALLIIEWRRPPPPGRERFLQLWREGGWITLGAAWPLALFAAPYFARPDGLWQLCEGVFIIPARRAVVGVDVPLPGLESAVFALPFAAALILAWWRPGLLRSWIGPFFLALAMGFILLLPREFPSDHLRVVDGLRFLLPLAAVIGAVWLATAPPNLADGPAPRLLALLPVASLTSLLQYPVSIIIYFAYAAPLIGLAAMSVGMAARRRGHDWGRPMLNMLLAFLIVFPVAWIHGQNPLTMLHHIKWQRPGLVPLNLPQAGPALRVAPEDAAMYEELARVIASQSPPGTPVYAQPDCPEVAFLSGRPASSPTFFPILGRENFPPAPEKLLADLRAQNVSILVIDLLPFCSPRFPDKTLDALRAVYPHEQRVGWKFLTLSRKGNSQP